METQTAVIACDSCSNYLSVGQAAHRGVVEPEDGVGVLLVRAVSSTNDCCALRVEPVAADVHHDGQLEEKGVVRIDLG